jgi:hypothetical protein
MKSPQLEASGNVCIGSTNRTNLRAYSPPAKNVYLILLGLLSLVGFLSLMGGEESQSAWATK